MSRRRSRLRSRIVLSTALISAVAMALMVGTVMLAMVRVTDNSVRANLDDRFSVIATALRTQPVAADPLPTPSDRIDDTTWLYAADGTLITGPDTTRRARATADELSASTRTTRVTRNDRVFRAGSVRLADGSRGVLVVSQSLEPYEATRNELAGGLLILAMLVTAGASGIAAWTVTRTLRPVEQMAGLAEQWSSQRLDARFDSELAEESDEIGRLGRTMNVLLDRVADALRDEQRLTSELAHELRTPLTAIRGEAELGLMAAADPSTTDRSERVLELTDQMSGTISTLLELARSGADRTPQTTPQAVVEAAVAQHPRHGTMSMAVDLAGQSETVIAGSFELAVRALSPLIDNAVKNARSQVRISIEVSERTAKIKVTDDGDGLPIGTDPEELFTPGARHGQRTGAGLGLALSRRVARSLGGDVDVVSARQPTTFGLTLRRR